MKKLFTLLLITLTLTSAQAQSEEQTLQWINAKLPSLMVFSEYGNRIKFSANEIQIPEGYVDNKITEMAVIKPGKIKDVVSSISAKGNTILTISADDIQYYEKYDDAPGSYTIKKIAKIYLSKLTDAEVSKLVKAIKHFATLKGASLADNNLF